jgi:hypothetical protein
MANDPQKWLTWYKNDGYRQINPYLKYGIIPNDLNVAYMKNFKNGLNSAMKTKKEQGINKEIILYRGHRSTLGLDGLFNNPGKSFIEKSYSSTSLIPLIQFGNKQIRIKLPDDVKFYTYPNNSANDGDTTEFEYLLESS